MKATIKIELADGLSASQVFVTEAPTPDMLKTAVLRTMFQMPDFVRSLFEEAAKPKELTDARQKEQKPVDEPAAGKPKKKPKGVLPADKPSDGRSAAADEQSQPPAPAAVPGAVEPQSANTQG
jgi:hypothetical protein